MYVNGIIILCDSITSLTNRYILERCNVMYTVLAFTTVHATALMTGSVRTSFYVMRRSIRYFILMLYPVLPDTSILIEFFCVGCPLHNAMYFYMERCTRYTCYEYSYAYH